MNLKTFKLEKFFEQHEFTAKYLLCCSDVEAFTMKEILDMASPQDLNKWNNLSLGYTTVPGDDDFRNALVEFYYRNEILKKENIICFSGAQEGIYCCLVALLTKEDHVITFIPNYQSLSEIPLSIGCEVTEIKLKEENEWKLDFNEIENSIKSNTKAVIINFPHNPTGQVLLDHEQEKFIDICRKYNIWIFSDEVYRYSGCFTKLSISESYEKGISLGVMSKSFGAPGLRIGWLSSQNTDILSKALEIKHYTTICNSAPSEVLSTIIIKNFNNILERNNAIIMENHKLLTDFITKHSNLFTWTIPKGGCIGFVKYLGTEGVKEFSDKILKLTGILLLPDSVYSWNDKYFRVGFGRRNMKEVLSLFEEAINK